MNATVHPIKPSWHLIDIGEHNAHMLDHIACAQLAAAKLIREGFTVLSLHVEHHRPVIWIQNCAWCGELEGAVMISRPGPFGPERIMVAVIEGCQVQWIVRGH
jgi:hypothetical protein